MAIRLDIQNSKFGTPFEGAYFRITMTNLIRSQSEEPKFAVMIDVSGYATSEATNSTHPIDFRRYDAPLDEVEAQEGDNFLSKCYVWVMQQPDMAGSVAV